MGGGLVGSCPFSLPLFTGMRGRGILGSTAPEVATRQMRRPRGTAYIGAGVGRPRSKGSRPALSDRPDANFHATSGLRSSKKFGRRGFSQGRTCDAPSQLAPPPRPHPLRALSPRHRLSPLPPPYPRRLALFLMGNSPLRLGGPSRKCRCQDRRWPGRCPARCPWC